MLCRRRAVQHVRAGRLPSGAILPPRWQELRRYFGGYEDQTEFEESIDEDTGISKITGEALAGHGLFMGTVAARTGIQSDLAAAIKPELRGRTSRPNATPSLLVILLTKGFAELEVEARTIQQLRSVAALEKPIDVITAIVDRLPVPHSSPYGEEGLAYALITDPPPSYSDSQVPLSDTSKGQQSLVLEIPSCLEYRRPDTFTIDLALASRSPTNGRGSLCVRRFEPNTQTGKFEPTSCSELQSRTIRLPFSAYSLPLNYQAPLVPLTVFHKITHCNNYTLQALGPARNTTTTPSANDSKAEVLHVAQDPKLEIQPALACRKALDAYSRTIGVPTSNLSPPFQVFALVVPPTPLKYHLGKSLSEQKLAKFRENFIQKLWPSQPIDVHGLVGNEASSTLYYHKLRRARFTGSLRGGARFFKVMDPWTGEMPALEDANSLMLEPYKSESNTGGQSLDQSIVKEGEHIMFFVARHRDPSVAQKQGLHFDVEANTQDDAIIFGTIPDATPDEQSVERVTEAAEDSAIVHYPHRFGCLSTGGMSVAVTNPLAGSRHIHEPGVLTRTKMNMPFGRLGLGMDKLKRSCT